ncbi:terminase large subunit [Gordonia phage Clawz]|uniref:Terminase n=1 Tax=Gordonia phage Clawz TaxID=2743910 RepID=A0AAE7K677_9CAUD|nr:terminase large subunit [Gordonia phage Clawz]QKY79914.1 terminase [Gordonia phage Clawz]
MTATMERDEWFDRVAKLPEPDRSAMLKWAEQQITRRTSLATCATPAELARSVDPEYVITPAIEYLAREVEDATTTRRGRLMITMPPQEGKTSLVAVWTVIRALQRNPDTRIILASYSQELAEQAAAMARNIIAQYGSDSIDPLTGLPGDDYLGISLASDKSSAAHWRIKGHKGGLVAVGLNGTITGRPADLIIVDDPLKGMTASDSAAERKKVIATFQGDLTTRLSATAPMILIQTRWNEADLAGWLLAREDEREKEGLERRWRYVNIPAQSEAKIPDALDREPGEWMVSARGRTISDWEEIKRDVGERVFYALYQGMPTPTTGGLFSPSWFERYRVAATGHTTYRIVSVDPAEKGTRDEAGIIGVQSNESGLVMWTHDWSGHMQSDEWARQAVILALSMQAQEITFEAYTTEQTYKRVIRQAWHDVRDQAKLIRRYRGNMDLAAAELNLSPRAPADPDKALHQLSGLKIPDQIDPPFRIYGYRGTGDKVARATGARQAASTGRLAILDQLPMLERQAVTWQMGQNSPDRMDAAVNGYERIMQLRGEKSVIAVPGDRPMQARQGSAIVSQMGTLMTPRDMI